MDTITHTLFGLTLYGSINKEKMAPNLKKSLFFTSLIGSQIPDSDVISQLWDTEGMYQMWHRGITHSLFMVPIWALLLAGVCYLLWRVKDRRILYMGLLSVFIHNTSDVFNTWGTGYLEPFSSIRLSLGTISIVDFVIWSIILIGFLCHCLRKFPAHRIYKLVWLFIVVHFLFQSIQGYSIYQGVKGEYDQHVVAAQFMPYHFQVIGLVQDRVEISTATVWGGVEHVDTLQTHIGADLEPLFEQNPKARTLYEWSPFVVIVEDEEQLGIYDPRFYRDGQSFLFESIEKR